MPTQTFAAPLVNADPGWLYYAPIGTTLPTNTVTASKFTDAWASPWVWLGATSAGSTWHYNLTTANIEVAESFDPISTRTTGRASTVDFTLADFTASRLAIALNGATKTVTGSTGTTLTKLTPPAPGAEVRFMLGWESQNSDIRAIAYQCINSGDISVQFQKSPNASYIPFTASVEISSTYNTPWESYWAGAARG